MIGTPRRPIAGLACGGRAETRRGAPSRLPSSSSPPPPPNSLPIPPPSSSPPPSSLPASPPSPSSFFGISGVSSSAFRPPAPLPFCFACSPISETFFSDLRSSELRNALDRHRQRRPQRDPRRGKALGTREGAALLRGVGLRNGLQGLCVRSAIGRSSTSQFAGISRRHRATACTRGRWPPARDCRAGERLHGPGPVAPRSRTAVPPHRLRAFSLIPAHLFFSGRLAFRFDDPAFGPPPDLGISVDDPRLHPIREFSRSLEESDSTSEPPGNRTSDSGARWKRRRRARALAAISTSGGRSSGGDRGGASFLDRLLHVTDRDSPRQRPCPRSRRGRGRARARRIAASVTWCLSRCFSRDAAGAAHQALSFCGSPPAQGPLPHPSPRAQAPWPQAWPRLLGEARGCGPVRTAACAATVRAGSLHHLRPAGQPGRRPLRRRRRPDRRRPRLADATNGLARVRPQLRRRPRPRRRQPGPRPARAGRRSGRPRLRADRGFPKSA